MSLKRKPGSRAIVAVSGGPDSVYLLDRCVREGGAPRVAHLNHGARGRDSDEDQRFVERIAADLGLPVGSRKVPPSGGRFTEEGGRGTRYRFLREMKGDDRDARILVAHTADDQVETVLMRVFEGAGISGLKGIPRRTSEGVERPLLETWRNEILGHLRRHDIPYRTDRSNFDTRFERNWIRHVLIPLLEKRYGKAVKKRLLALGERFREIDGFLESSARRWMKRNVKPGIGDAASAFRLPRASYSKLPAAARKKIVQLVCFEGLGIAPNERLLEAVDRIVLDGKPSGRLSLGKGASLSCRYGEAVFARRAAADAAAARNARTAEIVVREIEERPTAGRLRRLAAGERGAVFDADAVSAPFSVRPLRAGDRIRPFGVAARKKVKEILIDRKIARDERWGRPVVCDASGEIAWIPGVVRSSIAPVGPGTRRALLLRLRRSPT